MNDNRKFSEERQDLNLNLKKKVSRRRMLELMGMSAAGAALLAACGDPTATTAPATTAAPAATTAATNATTAAASATTVAAASATTVAAGSGQIAAGDIKASGKVVVAIPKDLSGTTKKVLDAFNAKNTGVTIDYQEQSTSSTEVHDKLATAFAAKDGSFDLIAADMPWAPEFGAAGFLLPLDKYVSSSVRSNFFEGSLIGGVYKDKLYALPWYQNGGVLYYRKDILEKGGVTPPNTFDELAAAATKLQTADNYGFVVNGFKNEGLSAIWLEVLWSYGGDFWNSSTNEVTVNSPEGEASVQFMVDGIYGKKFIPDKILTWKTPDAYNIFTQGNAVFMRGWSEYAPQAEGPESKIKGLWGVRPLVSAQGKKPAACLGNWNLAINAFSKNPDAAWKVMEYMVSPEAQKALTLGRSVAPSLKSTYGDKEVISSSVTIPILVEAFNSAKARPVTPVYPQISSDAIQENLSKALTRQITPKEAVKNMADTAKKLLDKYKG